LQDGSALPISARQESCRLLGELDEARRGPGQPEPLQGSAQSDGVRRTRRSCRVRR